MHFTLNYPDYPQLIQTQTAKTQKIFTLHQYNSIRNQITTSNNGMWLQSIRIKFYQDKTKYYQNEILTISLTLLWFQLTANPVTTEITFILIQFHNDGLFSAMQDIQQTTELQKLTVTKSKKITCYLHLTEY